MTSVVQSVLFDKTKWTLASAKKWLKSHGFTYKEVPAVDETLAKYRFRQRPPVRGARTITKSVGKGISLIIQWTL